uniref:Uncharacterized protein n=1 Tax=Knipowitschia caucasica TaxID=637954 RepID=A0AAV2JWT2_KNICA
MIRKLLDKSPVSLDIREQGKVILRLREVERRVSMPQGTDLKTKDLKTKAKGAARNLWEELGPISTALLQSNWFVEAAVRNLNIQLQDFDEANNFFLRVLKMFRTRRSRVSPGPLRAYLRSVC